MDTTPIQLWLERVDPLALDAPSQDNRMVRKET
jgi:hypothetical protein